jgi:ABC-type branched-subunit amino acid transport system substrate-binding protein
MRPKSLFALSLSASLALIGGVAVLAPAPVAAATCDPNEKSPGVTSSEIKLGATMPLTGSAAAGGIGASAAAKAYYDMINAVGGVQGHKISFTVLDDEYKPATAERQMRALVQRDRVFAIAGGEGTPNFLAIVPLLEREGVPAISPYAPSSELGSTKTPHIFMTSVNYITEFAIMARYVKDTYHPKSFSLVGVQGNVGDDAKAGMEQGIGDPSIKISYIPEVPGTPDFTPIATQLRDFGADWTFLILTNDDTGQLLQAMHRIGYKPQTAAWPGMDDENYLKPYAAVSQGMIVAEETAHLDSPDPLVKQFVADFTKETGHAPSKFEELGWVQAELVVRALQGAKALTRSCLMASLENIRDFKTGILPPISFGSDKRQGVNAVGLVQVKGDKTIEIVPFRALE